MARSRSGCTVRSCLPTMYQLASTSKRFPRLSPRTGRVGGRLGSPKRASAPAPKGLRRNTSCPPDAARYVRPRLQCGRRRRSAELALLRLRRFIGVRSERADINQADNAIVGSGAGDDASAVGVADQDDGAADPAHRCFHQGDVLCRCVEAVLRCNTLIPLSLKGNDQLAEARAIGPESVAEHDAWFGLCRFRFHILSFSPRSRDIHSGHKVNSAPPGFRLLRTCSKTECTRRLQGPPLSDPARPEVRRF